MRGRRGCPRTRCCRVSQRKRTGTAGARSARTARRGAQRFSRSVQPDDVAGERPGSRTAPSRRVTGCTRTTGCTADGGGDRVVALARHAVVAVPRVDRLQTVDEVADRRATALRTRRRGWSRACRRRRAGSTTPRRIDALRRVGDERDVGVPAVGRAARRRERAALAVAERLLLLARVDDEISGLSGAGLDRVRGRELTEVRPKATAGRTGDAAGRGRTAPSSARARRESSATVAASSGWRRSMPSTSAPITGVTGRTSSRAGVWVVMPSPHKSDWIGQILGRAMSLVNTAGQEGGRNVS